MRLYVSKLAHELLGDDLPRLAEVARQEITELMKDFSPEPGPFLHAVSLSEDGIGRSNDFYVIKGHVDETGHIEGHIQRGYWKSAGTLPEDHKIEKMRGKEVKMPAAVDDADNRLFRSLTEKDRQQ